MDPVVSRGDPPAHRPRAAVRLPLVVLGIGLLLGACSNPHTDLTPTAAPVATVALGDALDAMLRPAGPDSAEAFLRSLPPANEVRDVHVANPHDPRWTDTVRTLDYGGLQLTVYRVAATGDRFPIAVRVTSADARGPDGLRPGMTEAELRLRLGPPSEVRGSSLVFRVLAPGRAPYALTAELRSGRVTALTWSAYLD